MITHNSEVWKERKVFITGATGLVGSWLARSLLESGAEVTCLLRDYVPDSIFFQEGYDRKVNIARGDLGGIEGIERAINEYECDTVFHLGAQAVVGAANRDPVSTFEANIRGTWNLLEAARLRDDLVKRVIVASSDKAYGDQEKLPYEEAAPLMGKNPYDCSKSCADLISQSYAHAYRLPVAIARCGNFFGGGDLNYSRIVPGTIKSLYEGKKPVVRSDGNYVRDYIYVKDAASAYMTLGERFSEKLTGEAFNFSNERCLTVLEIVKLVCKAMKKSESVEILDEARNEIRKQHLSAQKARKVLGWKAEYSIERGIEETVGWYLDFFERAKMRR